MAAMMAGEAVDEPVLDHPRGAIGALDAVAAGAAQGQRREAPAVQKEQALLALRQSVGERVDERRREPAAAVGRVGPHVDRRKVVQGRAAEARRSEEHTSELQSLMRISYAVFCLKKKKKAQ